MKGGEELLEVGVSVGWWMGGARGGPGCTFARGLRPGAGPGHHPATVEAGGPKGEPLLSGSLATRA